MKHMKPSQALAAAGVEVSLFIDPELAQIDAAVEAYANEVRARTFPGPDHVYSMKKTT